MKKPIHHYCIDFYQKYLSPDTGLPHQLGLQRTPVCVFYPSCSEYLRIAIDRHGFTKGCYLFLKRFIRCHPWQKEHFDPVP